MIWRRRFIKHYTSILEYLNFIFKIELILIKESNRIHENENIGVKLGKVNDFRK